MKGKGFINQGSTLEAKESQDNDKHRNKQVVALLQQQQEEEAAQCFLIIWGYTGLYWDDGKEAGKYYPKP